MKPSAAAVLPLSILLVSCGGGGGGAVAPASNGSGFMLKTAIRTGAVPAAVRHLDAAGPGSMGTPGAPIDPTAIEFDFGVYSTEGGSLVVGYTNPLATADPAAAPAATTLQFGLTITDPITGKTDGLTDPGDGSKGVNPTGVNETFSAGDPSVALDTMAPGSTATDPGHQGFFLTRFSAAPGVNTTISTYPIVPQAVSELPQVNEVVLRIGGAADLVDGSGNSVGVVNGSPHFIYNGVLYADGTGSLTVNAAPFTNIHYIFFVPASRIGLGASFTVLGATTIDSGTGGAAVDPRTGNVVLNTVSNPVSHDWDLTDPNNAIMLDPSQWSVTDTSTWINNQGCAGLIEVVNTIAGTDQTTQAWKDLAAYFQTYFIKFYAARSTMFWPAITYNGTLIPGALGDTSSQSAAFEIIALDDITNGPMALDGRSTVNLAYDPTGSTFTLNNGVLDLEGNPPVKLSASITN